MARRGKTFTERSEISTAATAGWGVRRIASHLSRCPSVVSRELRRNSTKTRDEPLWGKSMSAITIGRVHLVAGSCRASTAILVALSRSSSGYFLGAARFLILPWIQT